MMPAASDSDKKLKSVLQARLLGPPETIWSGHPLEIPRRQPRAILYRLVARPEPISRAHLCLLLWPDIPESDARRHLSNQVYNLRRALPQGELIRTTGDRLALNPQKIWSDVAAFEHLSQSSERVVLQQAYDLYRGPFLDGFFLAGAGEFSQWAERERRHLERRYLGTLLALMTVNAERRDYDSAITCAKNYLEIDDLAEDVHRRLIDLYAAKGDRGAALRQYERCAAILERELGIDPLPETQEVYRAVLRDQTLPPRTLVAPNTLTTLPSLEAPLVGRGESLRKLEKAFDRAQAGVGVAVLVTGEAGVGKSRLLKEFISDYASEATILIGSGYEAQGDVPYLSLVEALRPLLPTVDWASLDADPVHLAQLTRLLPELRNYYPGLPESPSTEQEPEESSLFRGLRHLVLRLADAHPPVVLCLDDLHWTDETTRSWLGYLGGHLRKASLLLLLGCRREEARVIEPLRSTLARLDILEELRLEGLTLEDVEYLIRRLSGKANGSRQFYRDLQQLTGGNPFYLLETLRALFEAGSLNQSESGWEGDLDQISAAIDGMVWPQSITETVRRRVGMLRLLTTQVMQAAAVIGKRFNLDLVQATSGRSEREVVDALDELVARQLIEADHSGYEFKHDLIRGIVEDDLSYGRRRLLHRRAGVALEKTDPGEAAALARHFSEAGEISKAANYWMQAGDQARQLFAYQEAVEFYQRALAFQEENGAIKEAARTLMRLGMSYQIGYDYQRAHQAFEKSFALRRQTLPASTVDVPPSPHPLRLFLVSTPHPRLLFLGDPSSLDPSMPRASYFYIKQLFSGLLRSGPDWTIQPEVATDWEISDDGRSYIFHLRDDAVWSDGEPVTAQDFEFTWKRILRPSKEKGTHDNLYDLYTIRGAAAFNQGESTDPDSVAVRAVDSLTLEVGLEEPAEYFLNLLTHYKMAPVPRHVVERYGSAWTEPGKLVTNGPFFLKEWECGERVTLARNPNYFGRFRGNLSQVSISNHWLSPADQLESYRTGEVDILALGMDTYSARFQHTDEYHQVEKATTYLLGFGQTNSPFHDRRVRQALSLAIDREGIAKQTMHGFDMPVTGGFIPPGFPGHSTGIGSHYDPENARRLLSEAGFPGGKSFPGVEILVPKTRLIYARALQSYWDQHLGVEVQINGVDWADFFKHFRQSPMFIVGWVAQYPDPFNFLLVGARFLASFWQHQGFDSLIRRAASMQVQAERLRLYGQADRIMMEEAAIVPLFYRMDHYLVKPWVKVNLQDYSLKDVIIEQH